MSALATIITSTSSTMATTTSITLTLLLLAAPPRVGVSAERRRRGGDNSADLYSDSGAGALSLPDVQQPASMNVSSLGEALFLLSSMYLSLVQPSKVAPRQVALQFISPQFPLHGHDTAEFERYFRSFQSLLGSDLPFKVLPVASWIRKGNPGEILQILCNQTFSNNVVTVIYINNPQLLKVAPSTVRYLQQLLHSVGMPMISWDMEFSMSRKVERTLQLAPTMYQQTQAMLAFLKKFSWSHFSIVSTGEAGQEEFVTSLRNLERESRYQPSPDRYGQTGFRYEILSVVRLRHGSTSETIRSQLLKELDPDTRIILLHSSSRESKDIMDAARLVNLTGREYVWVLTAEAVRGAAIGSPATSYPAGMFAISYDSQVEEMQAVMKRALRVWLTGMKNIATADKLADMQWDTELSCRNLHLKKWASGDSLYEHLKNVSLAAYDNYPPTEFNDTGMVRNNKVYILNVIENEEQSPPPTSRGAPPFPRPTFDLGRSSQDGQWPAGGGGGGDVGNRFKDRTSGSSSPFGQGGRSNYSSSSTGRFSFRDRPDFRGSGTGRGTAGDFDGGGASPFERRDREETTTGPLGRDDRRTRKARRHLQRRRRLPRNVRAKRVFAKIGTWDGKDLRIEGIMWPGNSSIPPKGVPEKYQLKVVTYIEEPHVTSRPLGPNGTCDLHSTRCMVYDRDENDNRISATTVERCCIGLSIDLLQRISTELNFNFSLFEVESGGYGAPKESMVNVMGETLHPTVRHLASGYFKTRVWRVGHIPSPNGTEWTGVVGELMSGQADLSVAALTITPERENVIDFSVPFLETGITIVVAIRQGAISPTAFLEPYDYPSWTLILVFSVHATGASIFIFEWLSPYALDQGKTPLRVHKFSLFRSFWLIWAMLFKAAVSTDMPRGVSSRFLANIWALFAVVFLASYTANLAAFMITKEEYYDLSGIQDWRLKNPHHRQPPFKYATMPNGSTELNIKKNYPDLYNYMKKYPQHTVKEAVNALKKQKIQAFIYDATTLEYAVGKDDDCKLKSVGQRYAETGYGVGFRKGSRWVKKFDKVLLRMQDEGEIERLQKYWLAGACHKKSKQRGSTSHTLGILNFTSAFILLGGGVVLGAILLMVEHMYFRFGRKSLRKWDKCGCCSLISLSMGQSLTFEQSVMEAIDLHKHHRCKDPLCETQLWKAKHELDLALLKIDQLKRLLARQTSQADGDDSVWTYDPDATRQKNGVPRRRKMQSQGALQGSVEPLLGSDRTGADSTGATTPLKSSIAGKNSPSSQPSSSVNDSDFSSGSPRTPRRTKVNDGKIYENVDGGIDIESSI